MDGVPERFLHGSEFRPNCLCVSFPDDVCGKFYVFRKSAVVRDAEDFLVRANMFLTAKALKAFIANHMRFGRGEIAHVKREGGDRRSFASERRYFSKKFMSKDATSFPFSLNALHNLVFERHTIPDTAVSSADSGVVHLQKYFVRIGPVFFLIQNGGGNILQFKTAGGFP